MALGFNPVFRKDKQIINLFHQLLMFITLSCYIHLRGWMSSRPPQFNFKFMLRNEITLRSLWPAVFFSRLLSEILKETSEDIEEIEYLTDGSWRPIRDDKEKERERERSNTPEYPLVNICKSAVELGLFFFLLFFLSFPHSSLLLWFFGSRTDLKWALPLQAFLKQTVTHQLTAALASQANLEAAVPWAWRESQGEEEEPLRWPRQEPQW